MIKANPDEYSGWIYGQSLEEYVQTVIMSPMAEIDDVGIKAVFAVLLEPAGLALEIVKLDLSAGPEVYTIPFMPRDADGQETSNHAVVRLLHRP